MISIIIPTKNRVKNLVKVFDSLNTNSFNPNLVEVVLYVDNTDESTIEFLKTDANNHIKQVSVSAVIGSKTNLADTYNRAYAKTSGDIIMYSADDVLFRTKNWDALVYEEFNRYRDKICLVFGADGIQPIGTLATHGFLSRRGIETVGYVHPPKMGYNYSDNWLTDIYRRIDRLCYIPVYFEHSHWGVGKAPYDDTYKTGSDAPHQESIDLWQQSETDRIADSAKLKQSANIPGPIGNSNQAWIDLLYKKNN